SAVESAARGSENRPAASRGTRRVARISLTVPDPVASHRIVLFVRPRCIAAPPYVAMKCSVTSESGQPTPSPMTIGALTPLMFPMSLSTGWNDAQYAAGEAVGAGT